MASLIESRKSLHQQISDIESQYQALENQLNRLQPLANLGMAWAMTAHELNNLLTPMLNYSQLALQHPEDSALNRKALEKTQRLSEQAGRILEKVLILANPGTSRKEYHDVLKMVDDVFDCIGRDFSKDQIKIVRRIDPNLTAWVDVSVIRQVIMNLVLNAYHALKDKGGILEIRGDEQDESTRIEISDTGPGIPSERLHSIFTPFYTEGKAKGNGLGLAFCRKVIESHDGCITADSRVGHGTCFRILLPKKDR